MFQAPDTLITERLRLRHPQLTDAVALFEECCQDPEVTKYLIWRPHKDIQETTGFLTGCLVRWKSGEELTWGITYKESERVIGVVACRVRGPMHNGHCTFLVPEERHFMTPEAIKGSCLVGEPDEILAQIRTAEKAGLQELTLLPPMASARKVFKDFADHIMARY